MKIFILILILFNFVSCGKDVINNLTEFKTQSASTGDVASEEPYQYNLKGSGCYTGVQKETTLVKICKKLQNDEANEECAVEKREALFTSSECPGSFS